MDIQKIRQDFPLLNEKTHRKPVVYFDNACQSLRPQSVIDAINKYYVEFPACGGRSMHHLAERVTHECEEARSVIAKFLNASRKEEIVFTRNTTEGINLVAHSLGLKKGDVVLISDKEHNSNLIPWLMLSKKQGIETKIVHSKVDNTFDLEEFKKSLDDRVKLVAFGMTSNLDGVTIPAAEIIKQAHRNRSVVLLDAAQTVPHQKVDVRALDVDLLAFSGHKMLGPSGTGVLYGKYGLLEKLEPFMVGGDTVSYSTYTSSQFLPPPEKFEAGLQDYAGIIGLGEAAKYLQTIGEKTIQKQETLLNDFITQEISKIPRLSLIGPLEPELRGSIISFYLQGVDSHQIALMLDQMAGVLVRSGQHCVHSWFNAHGIPGSVRASFYFYNTMAEAELFVSQLKKIAKVL
jgi:cysteine desulfurase/selenocysteine lyase